MFFGGFLQSTLCLSRLFFGTTERFSVEMSSNYDFVVREKDMGINVPGKNGQIDYIEKASFTLELLHHVSARQQSGLLCRVYRSLREESK